MVLNEPRMRMNNNWLKHFGKKETVMIVCLYIESVCIVCVTVSVCVIDCESVCGRIRSVIAADDDSLRLSDPVVFWLSSRKQFFRPRLVQYEAARVSFSLC